VALADWRWQSVNDATRGQARAEYSVTFDDTTWSTLRAQGGGEPATLRGDNTAAIYRAHLALSAGELTGASIYVNFSGCDDEGWYFVNGQLIGESHEWNATPFFDVTKFLQAGDNVIAVLCRNAAFQGGLNPNVRVDIAKAPEPVTWSRSLFNGLAQIIVQSTRDAGEIKLTATAEGLPPAVSTVQTQPCTAPPCLP
jgi:beta-galactosidase